MFTFLRGKIFTFSCKKGYKSLLFTLKKLKIIKLIFLYFLLQKVTYHYGFIQKGYKSS